MTLSGSYQKNFFEKPALASAVSVAVLFILFCLAPATALAERTVVLTLSTEDPCKRVLAQLPADARGRRFTFKGISLSGDPLLYQACNKLRADLRGAAENWLKDASGYSSAKARFEKEAAAAKRNLYNYFLQFVAEQVHEQLDPEDQRRFDPNAPDMQQKALEWLHQPEQEIATYVDAFLERKSGPLAALFRDYMSGGSMQIITGLQDILKSAQDKLKRFTEVSHEVETVETPLSDVLTDHGLSGDYVDRFKGYEHKVRSLDKQFKLAEAVGIVVESMQTDNPEAKISGFFNMLAWAGSVAEDSRLPMVSLVGQIVSAYAEVAKEMLNQVNKLEEKLRQREGYCIGLATHSMRDPKNQDFISQFGQGLRACPIATQGHLTNVFVQAQPDDAQQLFFWDGEKFIKGRPNGGGVSTMRQAIGLILSGADLNYPAYQDKAQDIATIAAVYNTPYPKEDLRGRDRRNTSGLSGLVEEGERVIGEIASQIRRLENAVESFGDDSCSRETMTKYLEQETGKNVTRFMQDYEESASQLRISYILGFVEKHRPSLKGTPRRPAAYNTYSKFWDKIHLHSMLKVRGTVKNKSAISGLCPECSGADLSVSVSNGRELPGCEVSKADPHGSFTVHAMTESNDVSVRLSATVKGVSSDTETIDQSLVTLDDPPFVESFSLNLLVPLEAEPEEDSATEETPPINLDTLVSQLESLAANAETVSSNIQSLCRDAGQQWSSGQNLWSGLQSDWTAFQSSLNQLKSSNTENQRKQGDLQQLSQKIKTHAEAVVQARQEARNFAERSCVLAENIQKGQAADVKQAQSEADAAAGKAEVRRQRAEQNFQQARSLANQANPSTGPPEGSTPTAQKMQQTAQGLKNRLQEIRNAFTQAVEQSKQATAQKPSLEGFRLRGAQLVEDGTLQLESIQGTPAHKQQLEILEGLYGRIVSAKQGAEGCEDLPATVQPLQTEADALAGPVESALAELAALQQQAAGPGPAPDEALADIRATTDTAEIFAEAAASSATQANQCAQLARAVTQEGPEKIFLTAQVALEACEFPKALSLIQQLGADPRAGGLMNQYRERVRHENQTRAWFREGDALFKQKEYDPALAVLEKALAHTRCDKYRTRIQAAISQVMTARDSEDSDQVTASQGDTGGDTGAGAAGADLEEDKPYYAAFEMYVLFPNEEPPKVEVPSGADKNTRERIKRKNKALLKQFVNGLSLSNTHPQLLDNKGETPAIIGIGSGAKEAFPADGFTPGAKYSLPISGTSSQIKGGGPQSFRTAMLLKVIGVFESREAVFARFPKLASQAKKQKNADKLWDQAVLQDEKGTFTISDPKQGKFTVGPLSKGWTRANMQSSLEMTRLIFSMFGALSCFVATAVYEDPHAEALDVLRNFRDRVLLESEEGRRLVRLYYKYGPGLATEVKQVPKLAPVLRGGFDSLVSWMQGVDWQASWKRQLLGVGITMAEFALQWLPDTPEETPAEIREKVRALTRLLGVSPITVPPSITGLPSALPAQPALP